MQPFFFISLRLSDCVVVVAAVVVVVVVVVIILSLNGNSCSEDCSEEKKLPQYSPYALCRKNEKGKQGKKPLRSCLFVYHCCVKYIFWHKRVQKY